MKLHLAIIYHLMLILIELIVFVFYGRNICVIGQRVLLQTPIGWW